MYIFQAWVMTYLLNSFWQVPLIFATAWLATRLSRSAGPAFEHRVWVTALFAEVILPACSLQPAAAFHAIQHRLASLVFTHHAVAGQVTVTMGDIHPVAAGLHLPHTLLAIIASCYLVGTLFFSASLILRLRRTFTLSRLTQPITLTGYANQSFHRYAHLFKILPPSVATSRDIAGPVTLGIRRALLLLPQDFQTDLSAEDFDAALAHEFAHMRRRDFVKNLCYKVLALPAAFHPLVWLTQARIAETRERLCDALAANALAGPQRYARSLLRLASRFATQSQPAPTHAIGIFDANHFQNFERRVMHLTTHSIELKGARRLVTTTACLALLTVACASALAFRMQVAAPTVQAASQATPQIVPDPAPVTVAIPRPAAGDPPPTIAVDIPSAAAGNATASNAPIKIVSLPNNDYSIRPDNANVRAMIDTNVRTTVDANVRTAVVAATQQTPDSPAHIAGGVIAGNRLNFIQPIYPADAKAAGIEGTVLLNAVIGKDGTITSLKLISGPDQLAQAAWDAVKQWTYKPYLLNGEPTAVETTITVNFSLQH